MVESAVNDFFSYLSLQKRFSPLTVKSYQTDINQFFEFVSLEIPINHLSEISHLHLRSYIASLMDKGNSATTVNRKISTLKTFFKFLLKNNIVQTNPTQKIIAPKKVKKLPEFLDEDQTGKLFSDLKFEEGFNGVRDKLVIETFYQTGIRRSELINLKESDIDFISLQLKVLGKRNKERIIPFSLAYKRNLESYLDVKKSLNLTHPSLLVSTKNKPLSAMQVTKIVSNILAMVTTAKKKSPHVLRHTFATQLLNNGADINAVKELLGHASLAATQLYTHNTIDKLKKSYNQAHPRSGN